ncbi:hypothetical protein C3F00_031700 [Pseudomonas sp. MWU13-2860]|nr:hypothetical protein C3F00_031700 [Pseudomonas sp. MWU13-2860]
MDRPLVAWDGRQRAKFPVPVGASLLAMIVNDNAGHPIPRGAWATIASKLAPTPVFFSVGTHRPVLD